MALSEKFFISDRIEERSIEMGDGTSEVLWFKHLPNTAFERYSIWCHSDDEDVVAVAGARLLTMGLVDPDGKPALEVKDAERLKRPVMQRMVRALLDVNGYGKAAEPAGNV